MFKMFFCIKKIGIFLGNWKYCYGNLFLFLDVFNSLSVSLEFFFLFYLLYKYIYFYGWDLKMFDN